MTMSLDDPKWQAKLEATDPTLLGNVAVIGIMGPAQVGKTTSSEILASRLKFDFDIKFLKFADPIHKALACLGVSKRSNHKLYRRLAQGLAKARQDDPDFYVKLARKQIQKKMDEMRKLQATIPSQQLKPTLFLIDDTRYHNEIKMIDSLFGNIIYIQPSEDRMKRLREEAEPEVYRHESEQLSQELLEDVSDEDGNYMCEGVVFDRVNNTKDLRHLEKELGGWAQDFVHYHFNDRRAGYSLAWNKHQQDKENTCAG